MYADFCNGKKVTFNQTADQFIAYFSTEQSFGTNCLYKKKRFSCLLNQEKTIQYKKLYTQINFVKEEHFSNVLFLDVRTKKVNKLGFRLLGSCQLIQTIIHHQFMLNK